MSIGVAGPDLSARMSSASPIPLAELPDGQWATVADIPVPQDRADHDLVLRLMELGFVPGERVRIVAEGLGRRDPLAVRVGRSTFALRHHEAALILVNVHP
ncbi:MAG: hypothetical protein GFGODING_02355 [Flavobacteriales bacterium]|nr:hypothetical protein [Flavobacteriales bacterium]